MTRSHRTGKVALAVIKGFNYFVLLMKRDKAYLSLDSLLAELYMKAEKKIIVIVDKKSGEISIEAE